MLRLLAQPDLSNEEFIFNRVGSEAIKLRQSIKGRELPPDDAIIMPGVNQKNVGLYREAVAALQKLVGDEAPRLLAETLFRNRGEIHCWMYDRFSLRRLMAKVGVGDVKVCAFDESRIPDFYAFGLDSEGGRVRKPDSIFAEGAKGGRVG